MDDPKNHHFVPEVYLKGFSNSEKQLYQLRKDYKKISIKSVGKVCYEPYYFKVNSKDNLLLHKLKDQFHIEKNVFKKQENAYSKLLKKVTFPSLTSISLKKVGRAIFLRNPADNQKTKSCLS